jgi:inosose dehydratase
VWTTVDGDKRRARVFDRRVRIGNAPVSFGVYSTDGDNPPFEEVLEAIASAGYQGTELGPFGYFPTSPNVLSRVLAEKNLALASSFVGLPLDDKERREASVASALEVARLLATQGVRELIIADDDDNDRARIAGRVPFGGAASWSDGQWKEAARTLHAIARALREQLSMRVVVHHHVGTFIETAEDIDRLMFETDPELVGLLADTGHLLYGGADPMDILARHRARVWYVHLKDVNAEELARVRSSEISVREATARGVFCPLGDGAVELARFIEKLRGGGYDGWLIVEQDVIRGPDGVVRPDPTDSAKKSRALLRKLVDL